MSYTAKQVYQQEQTASSYERVRFRSWRGRLVDHLEKQLMMNGVARVVGGPHGQLVMDAPCGTARLADEFLNHGYRVIAIDISREMILQGEALHQLHNRQGFVGYVCCDLEHLPFRDEGVDVISSLRVMGHLPPSVAARVLSEFRRASRRGTVIMFSINTRFRQVKRRLFQILGLRAKSLMWFPVTRQEVETFAKRQSWTILLTRDLVRWISESCMYVFGSQK